MVSRATTISTVVTITIPTPTTALTKSTNNDNHHNNNHMYCIRHKLNSHKNNMGHSAELRKCTCMAKIKYCRTCKFIIIGTHPNTSYAKHIRCDLITNDIYYPDITIKNCGERYMQTSAKFWVYGSLNLVHNCPRRQLMTSCV